MYVRELNHKRGQNLEGRVMPCETTRPGARDSAHRARPTDDEVDGGVTMVEDSELIVDEGRYHGEREDAIFGGFSSDRSGDHPVSHSDERLRHYRHAPTPLSEGYVAPTSRERRPPREARAVEHRRDQRRAEHALLKEGDVLLGKYHIDRMMLEGPICVAMATHLDLQHRVQVVVLGPKFRGLAAAHERQMRAVRVVAQMQSEHLCRIADAGKLGSGASFVVAELAGDTSVAELLRRRGPLPVTDAVDFAIQAADALAEAHTLGLVHGNLSPRYLRIAAGIDGAASVRLHGFGMVPTWAMETHLGSQVARASARAASALRYLAPEQIRRPYELQSRVDIWALGAILFESLAGTSAFSGESPAATLAMIAADRAPVISAFRDDVPRLLESAIQRCLEKDRDARFESMGELVRALVPFASEESQRIADRVVRVVARNPAGDRGAHRSNSALVRVPRVASSERRPAPQSTSADARPAQAPPNGTRPMAIALGVGLLAGVGGAFAATCVLVSSTVLPVGSGALVMAQPASPAARSYAATPIAPAVAPNGLIDPTATASARPDLVQLLPRDQRPSPGASAPSPPVRRGGPPSSRMATAAVSRNKSSEPENPPGRAKGLFDDIH